MIILEFVKILLDMGRIVLFHVGHGWMRGDVDA